MWAFFKSRPFRICRVVFRWMRITFLLAVLTVVALLAHLHWTGLPGWLKNPILGHLRDRGFKLEFSRMRLGWGPAIIVDDASFQRISDQPEPRLSAKRADLELKLLDLAKAKVAVRGLEVSGARLRFPPAGQANNSLSLENIQVALDFPETNSVRVTNASATFRGVRLTVNGALDHAEAVRGWTFLKQGRAQTSWQAILARVTDTLDQIHFGQTPRVIVTFSADARDLDTAMGHLSFGAPGVTTPWGDARRIRLEADFRRPLATNETFLDLTLGVEEAATRWSQGSAVLLTASVARDSNFDLSAHANISAQELDGSWKTNFARATRLRWAGTAGLNGTNFHLLNGGGDLRMEGLASSWGTGRDLHVNFDGTAVEGPGEARPEWGFWEKLAAYRVHLTVAGEEVATPKVTVGPTALTADWEAPRLSLSKIKVSLYGGRLEGAASLDVASREVEAETAADFDERRATNFLTAAARHWLSQFEWTTPPAVHAALRARAPEWVNRPADWTNTLRKSLQIAGDFAARDGTFRDVPVDRAWGQFGYTNRVWTLPDLEVWRGAGKVRLSYEGSDATHQFHFLIDSAANPTNAQLFLPEAQRHWLNEAHFATPPEVHAEVWGTWHQPELIGIKAKIFATNFTARGEHVDSVALEGEYTNKFFRAHDARLVKETQYATVGLAEGDLRTKIISVTNVLGAVSPDLLRRVTAPRKIKWLELIQFEAPAAISLAGSFQIGNPLATDLKFEARGEGFHFTNILADKISGGIRWQGRHVDLTNIQAALYQTGTLVGSCGFDWDPKKGTDFSCNFRAKDVELPALARGLTGRPNKLEGMLDGDLIMDRSNSHDRRTWKGLGEVHVHNALLWDIKIFGIFSPVLNAISPGAGNSRAYEASAHYVITNGIVGTDDLTVRSTGFRLLYKGTVNTVNKDIDGRMEAELLRDTPMFGSVLSVLLSPLSKLFEYKMTGTLHDPKSEPLYIPQPLMVLLRPFHTLKSLGSGSEPGAASSGSAPAPADAAVEPNKR